MSNDSTVKVEMYIVVLTVVIYFTLISCLFLVEHQRNTARDRRDQLSLMNSKLIDSNRKIKHTLSHDHLVITLYRELLATKR